MDVRRAIERWLIMGTMAGVGCATQGTITPVQPAPTDATEVPVPPAPGLPPAEAAQTPALPRDSFAIDLRQAQDSAADAAVLEQLEAAHPPAPGPNQVGDPFEALSESNAASLDLTTYAEHERVRYYLDFFLGPARNRMEIWLARLPVYEPMVRQRFQAAGLPSDLVYLGIIESGFSNVAVSRSRAVGMWQFMRGTAKWMGLRVDRWVDERRDPVKATDAAARYLAMLTQQFGGSYYLAAAAYNAGPGRVSRGLTRIGANGGGDASAEAEGEDEEGFSDEHFFSLADSRYLKRETKDYVPKLIAASLIARNPAAYGFPPVPRVEPFPFDSLVVPDMTGLDVVARLAGVPLATIRELNPHYLRLATPPGRRSVVRLPAGTQEKVTLAFAELPARERVLYREHVVARGETMGVIARRYGVGLGELRDANPRARPTALRVGQTLVIPTAGVVNARAVALAEDRPARSSVHVVRRGETLSSVASRYRVSVANLRAWNNLGSSNLIRAGQRLRVGGAASAAAGESAGVRSGARTHVVRRGETLSSLARRYGLSIQELMEANGLSSSRLQAGQRLRIPA